MYVLFVCTYTYNLWKYVKLPWIFIISFSQSNQTLYLVTTSIDWEVILKGIPMFSPLFMYSKAQQ